MIERVRWDLLRLADWLPQEQIPPSFLVGLWIECWRMTDQEVDHARLHLD